MKTLRQTFALGVLGVFMTPSAFASTARTTVEAFNQLAIGASFLTGVVIFGLGLYGIYEISGANQSTATLRSCILKIISGAFLLSIASFHGMWYSTAFGEESIDTVQTLISIDPGQLISQHEDTFITRHIPPETQNAIYSFLYLFGLGSFIKGTYLISRVGEVDGGSKIGVKNVLAHLICGMGLMHPDKLAAAFTSVIDFFL